jgi:hypothetical protein
MYVGPLLIALSPFFEVFLQSPSGPAKRFLKAGITNRYEVFLVQAHSSQADLPLGHDRSGGKNYAGARGLLARLG